MEAREGVNPTHMDGRGVWVKFTHVMINWQFLVSVKASVTKLSKALAQVPRKAERGLRAQRGDGGRGLSENSSSVDKLSVPRFSLEL